MEFSEIEAIKDTQVVRDLIEADYLTGVAFNLFPDGKVYVYANMRFGFNVLYEITHPTEENLWLNEAVQTVDRVFGKFLFNFPGLHYIGGKLTEDGIQYTLRVPKAKQHQKGRQD